MIVTDHHDKLLTVAVFGEFTLADFQEFEDMVRDMTPSEAALKLFFDLRQMADFTVDVAWEEIKFSRQHPHDFGRIAVLTDSQWVTWSAWLTKIFVDAELNVFTDEAEARAWLEAGQ